MVVTAALSRNASNARKECRLIFTIPLGLRRDLDVQYCCVAAWRIASSLAFVELRVSAQLIKAPLQSRTNFLSARHPKLRARRRVVGGFYFDYAPFMPDILIEKPLALLNTLLTQIQKIIRVVMPDFLDPDLKKEEVRHLIVAAASPALVHQFPLTQILPLDLRKRVIRRQVDVVLDISAQRQPACRRAGTSLCSFIVATNPSTPQQVLVAHLIR